MPLILFIVDGYTNIKALNNGDEYFMMFQDYLREGANFGVRFILTCNHTNEVSARSKQELDYRIALQAKDHYEYSDILDVRCKFSPPEINGRGMCVQDGRPLAYQTAMLDCDKHDQERAALLRERLSWLAQRYTGMSPAERLPMADANQSYQDFCANFQVERFPLGYSRKDMKPIAMPFQQFHSASVYFGNPKGVSPVFQNLLTAAQYNHMETIIVRRQTDSVFDETAPDGLLGVLTDRYTLLESTEDGLSHLAKTILQAINDRNILRDDYSVQQGIPLESKGRAKKAIKYIRANSSPILVIMESFSDFCKGDNENPELKGYFTVFFEQMRGYNIYFVAGFYPDDENSMTTHQLMKCFNKEEFLLLFGGRYDKVIKPDLPFEVKRLDMMDPLYNRFLMKYQEVFYPMVMPCGELESDHTDPDEAAII